MIQVLMVCLGNICRSPMAQAVASHMAARVSPSPGNARHWVRFESAGTRPGLVGSACDPRTRAALQRKGYAVPQDRCRKITLEDFERFDLILAMDSENLSDLLNRCPEMHRHKVRLFLAFADQIDETDVPDPYYGDAKGFDRVLHLCEAGATGLIRSLQEQYCSA